jgi:hypothetical protein
MKILRFLLWAVRGLRPMNDANYEKWPAEDPSLTVERTPADRDGIPTEAKPKC